MNLIQRLWKRLTQGEQEPEVKEVKSILYPDNIQLDRFWTSAVDRAERLGLSRMHFDLNRPALHVGFHASWRKARIPHQLLRKVTKDFILPDGERAKLVLEFSEEVDGESLAEELVAKARLLYIPIAQDAVENVSPPAVTIVWDPEIVTSSEYAQLVNAIGEIFRSEGASGLKLIESNSRGVIVESEVLA